MVNFATGGDGARSRDPGIMSEEPPRATEEDAL
jgi:hypothetical protein